MPCSFCGTHLVVDQFAYANLGRCVWDGRGWGVWGVVCECGRGRRREVDLWGPPDDIEGSALIVTTGQKNLQPHPVPAADEHLELFLGVNPKGGGSRFPPLQELPVNILSIPSPLAPLALSSYTNYCSRVKKLSQLSIDSRSINTETMQNKRE